MADLYDNLTWRETSPGVWQREVDEAEQFYTSLIKLYAASGRMQFAITGHVSLIVSLPNLESANAVATRFDDSLRIAWLRLRHDIPTIASRVVYDSVAGKWKKVYETVPQGTSRNAWLRRTFQTVLTGQTGPEWANSDPPAPREATLFVVVPPATIPGVLRRDLVLRCPHDIIDGIGTFQLFGKLITHVVGAFTGTVSAQPCLLDGSEAARLSPVYRVAAAVPAWPTEAQAQKLAALGDKKTATGWHSDDDVEDIGIPYHQGPVLPGKHQRAAHTISTEQSVRLLSALKRVGATATHAFHAAIAVAIRDAHAKRLQSTDSLDVDEERHVRYKSFILRNERSKCTHPFDTSAHAAAVYHSIDGNRLAVRMLQNPPSHERNAEFARILEHMRDYYHSVRDDIDHYALAPYIWATATPLVSSQEPRVPVPPPNPRPSVSLSSMGVIDRMIAPELGPVSVHDPWVTGEELGNGFGLYLTSFRGQLTLSAAYNDAWHDEGDVEEFLAHCVEIVFAWTKDDGEKLGFNGF